MQETRKETLRAYWREAAAQLKQVRSLAGAGVLSALGIALKSLAINVTQLLRISFFFLTVALTGYMYGPLVAALASVVVDVIGLLAAPTGAYFFGFTLSAVVDGFIYGCWLYKKPVSLWRCFAAVGTSMLVVSLVLNPLWLYMLQGAAFWAMLPGRLLKNAIQLPVNVFLLYGLLQVVQRAKIAPRAPRV